MFGYILLLAYLETARLCLLKSCSHCLYVTLITYYVTDVTYKQWLQDFNKHTYLLTFLVQERTLAAYVCSCRRRCRFTKNPWRHRMTSSYDVIASYFSRSYCVERLGRNFFEINGIEVNWTFYNTNNARFHGLKYSSAKQSSATCQNAEKRQNI